MEFAFYLYFIFIFISCIEANRVNRRGKSHSSLAILLSFFSSPTTFRHLGSKMHKSHHMDICIGFQEALFLGMSVLCLGASQHLSPSCRKKGDLDRDRTERSEANRGNLGTIYPWICHLPPVNWPAPHSSPPSSTFPAHFHKTENGRRDGRRKREERRHKRKTEDRR